MCGIWAVFPNSGKFDNIDMDIVNQVMTITSLRGKDSTGVAVVHDAKAKPRTIKMVGGPDYLLGSEAWEKVAEFALKKGQAMFGHGRFGTKGAATAKNAHPHTVDHITLVHNGTIHFGLHDDMAAAETDNDSLGLCYAIAKEGLVEALEKVSGAYALIIHDAKQEKIFVVRNDERPLHMIEWMQNKILMSEADALKFLAARSSNIQPNMTYFPKHVIFSYDLKTGKFEKDETLKDRMAKKWSQPTQHYPQPVGGVSGAGNKVKKTTSFTRQFPNGMQLMLLTCDKLPKGQDYRCSFLDEDSNEIVSYTPKDMLDRIGSVAKTGEIQVTRYASGEEHQFVKFRELKWPDAPVTEEEPAAPVRFLNGIQKSAADVQRIVKNMECALCQGIVKASEAPDTILLSNGGLICPDCIKQGRHHAFGFGQ